ncbi:MAG: RsmG family class I SAM-dependent methyltransferase [Acidobacteriota bacterium]
MTQLPEISRQEIRRGLDTLLADPLSDDALDRLHGHYQELRRWSPRLALIGPGTRHEILARHYGEALAALPLITSGGVLVDVGSGAGFPGFVLACVRSDLRLTLIEARGRKCAFLQAAARRAALPCQCLNARVGDPLPEGVPERVAYYSVRALRLPPKTLSAMAHRLRDEGRFLFWAGAEDPELPVGFRVRRQVPIPGSKHRRVLEVEAPPANGDLQRDEQDSGYRQSEGRGR